MTDIYGLPDTTGRKEGDTWTTTLPDGRTVVNTIPVGNGNQTVDQIITNPDGSTTNSRVAGNGQGGWQRWNDDSTGTSSYAGKDTQDSDVYGQHFNPGASTSGRPNHEFGMSSDYKTTATASYNQDGNRIGTDIGVANKSGLYDNVHVDNFGNKTFTTTSRDEKGAVVSTFTGQIDSDGYGWKILGDKRWEVAPDSQGQPVFMRTEETPEGVHHYRLDETGKLTDEFRGNQPGLWYRDTINPEDGSITRLDVNLGVTVYNSDGTVRSSQKPDDKRTGLEKVVDTTGEFLYGSGRFLFGMTDVGAVYNAVSPLWGQHDAAVTADDVLVETAESFKPLFTGDGHERWQTLQAMIAGTNSDEFGDDSIVSTTKAVLTAATFFLPGPKGLGALGRRGRAGEELLIREMAEAGATEAEILASLREVRAAQEALDSVTGKNDRGDGSGERLTPAEILAEIENSRRPTGVPDGAFRHGDGAGRDANSPDGSHSSPGISTRNPRISDPADSRMPNGLNDAEKNRWLYDRTAPADTSNMAKIGDPGVSRWPLKERLLGGLRSGARGFIGEAFSRAKLRLEGYEILAENQPIRVPDGKGGHVTVKPDFIAIDPKTNRLVFVEAKFGNDPTFRPNQLEGYPGINAGDTSILDLELPKELRDKIVSRMESENHPLESDIISGIDTHAWNVDHMPTPEIIREAQRDFETDYFELNTSKKSLGTSANQTKSFLNDLVNELDKEGADQNLPPSLPDKWSKPTGDLSALGIGALAAFGMGLLLPDEESEDAEFDESDVLWQAGLVQSMMSDLAAVTGTAVVMPNPVMTVAGPGVNPIDQSLVVNIRLPAPENRIDEETQIAAFVANSVHIR
ncbi:hypothetical protein APR11_001588 [Nocardia amikacinitolerans]|uniref:hypothetical protein n=1 Tax=Nocardia amikacinitolerans TaxID=756689 RepID=UPI0020A48B83|nr:hypothetical protein [Nocardia amikacinitolerans]MCP2295181.1 hypothetical protein [Nocardia amikacinitolerans]